MRFFRNAAFFLLAPAVLQAELGHWVQNLAVETDLREVFFRQMTAPDGAVDARRPPSETRAELTKRIAANPADTLLYRLRASEAELALDFAAAENDWKQARDPQALADFYHRRMRPAEEVTTLETVHTKAAYGRAVQVAQDALLPDTTAIRTYRAWIAHFPTDTAVRRGFQHYLVAHGQFTAAERELAAWRQAIPADETEAIEEEANLGHRRGTVNQAIAVYERAFRPLADADFLKSYFDLLAGEKRLRDFLAQARTAAQAQPESLDAAARLFHYYRHENNPGEARRALLEYRLRKKHWTAAELDATAQLMESIPEYNEAARAWYALYSMPGADAAARERGLAGLINVLLTAPEQPIAFGAGDLSLYRDIGAMDRHPGFLNGILSLVLNTTTPRYDYEAENQKAVAYFHRGRAMELLAKFDAEFPRAPQAPALHARMVAAYAAYVEDDAVVKSGERFLSTYAQGPQRTEVALLVADAHARNSRYNAEFAVYDRMLQELPSKPKEYQGVLDRYIARLGSLDRPMDALALYRREIGRNPDDAALYEKLAAFLDQRNLADQVEQVYKQAVAHFQDATWNDKLARWYLRMKRGAEFAALTEQVANVFSGTGLETYFRDVVAPASLDPALYLQVNLYAHRRFPDNLTFVRNLLIAYGRRETADPEARSRLLRAYWYFDNTLRAAMFEALSRAGKLEAQLAAAPQSNPAAARFYVEGQAWRGHFEEAAPAMLTVAREFPGSPDVVLRATALQRSLGHTEAAVALAKNLVQAAPRDREALARVGDIYGDREMLGRARPYWNRITAIDPGKPDSYLEAATIFWDYFQYRDALRIIGEGRNRLRNPALFAYEAGAIYEARRNSEGAAREYLRNAVDNENSPAERRLVELSKRPAWRLLVDRVTAEAGDRGLRVRVAVLDAQQRKPELLALLTSTARTSRSQATLAWVQSYAGRIGATAVEQAALEQQAAISRDPVETLRLRLALVRLLEQHQQTAAAERIVRDLERGNPAILGIVRAAADFYWRNKMPARSVDVLVHAAARANDDLRKEFALEAARKAADSREFDRARSILQPLLAADPFEAGYLAVMADTWALAGNDQALRDFYRATIDAMRNAPLAPEERNARIAGLRRGLIVALTHLGDRASAVDQYAAIIDRYPEDQGLIREAAAYAAQHNLTPRLLAYYNKAAADSPKDYRFPMVLARLQTHAEDFPAAIAAYTHAVAIRPDRIDLFQDRGTLEERLMQFAAAEATYRKVWELSYRDPHWLERVALLQARQGKQQAVMDTLRQAWLEGRPARAEYLLRVAEDLESWGMLAQAIPFARQAADPDSAVYCRILTRARDYQGVLGAAAAQAVDQYYAPEEKVAFAAAVEKNVTREKRSEFMRVARLAGLYDLEARWLLEEMAAPRPQSYYYGDYQLKQLQEQRMRYAEYAHAMETLIGSIKDDNTRRRFLGEATAAYRAIGDFENQRRMFEMAPALGGFLQLAARRDPNLLLEWAPTQAAAVDLAVGSGNAQLALAAIQARARVQDPVWSKAYTALASLYYYKQTPDATALYRDLLSDAAIGDRLAHPVDRRQRLAGDVWFYYGARFGEYLALHKSAGADDFLAAMLEQHPGQPEAYMETAATSWELGRRDAAIADYTRAVELDPDLGKAHDSLAVALWDSGRKADAIARWKLAIGAFEDQQNEANLANSFWTEAPEALRHIGERGAWNDVRPQIESLLRSYVARHDYYRADPLFHAAARYGHLDVAAQPALVLRMMLRMDFLPAARRIAACRRLIELEPAAARSWQRQLAELQFDAGDMAAAESTLAAIPPGRESEHLAIRIAAKTGKLAALLDRYRRDPATAPDLRSLLEYAGNLESAAANQLREFAYTRELERGNFDASNFLGLAQVRLDAKDRPAALALLRRMMLVSGEPFVNQVPAADLLERYGDTADATAFLRERLKAVPWDTETRVRLAIAAHDQAELRTLIADNTALYRVRAQAARELGKLAPEPLATGELRLLSGGHIGMAEAQQPFYYDARLVAASQATQPAPRVQLLMDAIAVHPAGTEPWLPLFRAAFAAENYDLAATTLGHNWEKPDGDARFTRDMAAVYEKLGNLRGAIHTLETADAKLYAAEIGRLKKEQSALQQNAARRPHVTDALTQAGIVRPRVEP